MQPAAFWDWLCSQHSSLEIHFHVAACINNPFLYIAEQYPMTRMYQVSLTMPPVKVIWVFFPPQFLAIINKAARNIHIWVFLVEHKSSFFWDKCPGVHLVCCMVVACLAFKKLPNCFSEWLCHFTFSPATSEWGSFSASLPAFDVVIF